MHLVKSFETSAAFFFFLQDEDKVQNNLSVLDSCPLYSLGQQFLGTRVLSMKLLQQLVIESCTLLIRTLVFSLGTKEGRTEGGERVESGERAGSGERGNGG